jgi:hypothetical protein
LIEEKVEMFDVLLEEVSAKTKTIKDIVLGLNKRKAFKLLCGFEDSSTLLNALFSLQQIHGTILSMHPESIYDEDVKYNPNTIFNKIIEVSQKNTEFIDITLDVYQLLKSETPRFLASEDYCYSKFLSPIEGTQWSLYGLLLRVIGNCEKLISFLNIVGSGSADRRKGELSRAKTFGRGIAEKNIGKLLTGGSHLIPEPPPSLKKKVEQGEQ